MAPQGTKTMMKSLLQGTLTPLNNPFDRACAVFPEIRCQSSAVGPFKIRKFAPGEGFVQMHVSIDEPWQHHQLWIGFMAWKRGRLQQMSVFPAQAHSSQTLGGEAWLRCPWRQMQKSGRNQTIDVIN